MEHVANLGAVVSGFTIHGSEIDCICGRELIKLDKITGEVILKKVIFEKEGFSRKLTENHGQIFIYDFCTLFIYNQNTYELVDKWQLGNDLSSDICGMLVDEDTVYCSMRNGGIITLDRNSFARKEVTISDSSMWSMKAYQDYIVCGTVDGKVLLVDKKKLSVIKTLNLGKQNIGSFYLNHDTLYVASQDKKFFKVDLTKFEVVTVVRNAHQKMFDCVGEYDGMVITISYPCSEIALWEKETLEKKKEIQVPLRLSGRTCMEHNLLYLSSRNIMGIDKIDLSNI